jgi:ribonuclease BN (tRNA processing enzyme)
MALHYDGEVKITKVAGMSPMMNNGYLITCPETNECILIDTPGEPEKLLGAITDENIKAILITHNHGDHLAGFGEITGLYEFFAARGISADQARTCMADFASLEKISKISESYGTEDKISQTPTFVLNGNKVEASTWEADECPLCKEGSTAVKPGSRGT